MRRYSRRGQKTSTSREIKYVYHQAHRNRLGVNPCVAVVDVMSGDKRDTREVMTQVTASQAREGLKEQ